MREIALKGAHQGNGTGLDDQLRSAPVYRQQPKPFQRARGRSLDTKNWRGVITPDSKGELHP
jgi:hypothetical protein